VPGLIHGAIFFSAIFLGATMVWEHVLRAPLPIGALDPIYRFGLDVCGLLFLGGLAGAAVRRYLLRPPRLHGEEALGRPPWWGLRSRRWSAA